MTKLNGLGQQLLVDGFNISGDVGAWSSGCPHGVYDVTGLDKFANERILGRKDGRLALNAFFNPSAGAVHDVLSTVPTTDRQASLLVGSTLGAPAASILAKQITYDGDRPADGSMGFNTELLSNGFPLEWGIQLTAGTDDLTAAAAGTGVDTLASASFGLQAYLHVTAFTGTSATVTIQDNTADVPGTYTDVTGAAFAAATAVGAQRIQTSRTQTVRRWVRFNVTGVFSALTLAVVVVKNEASAVF